MNEAVILTSSKDLNGIGVVDLRTASPLVSNFKNCVADVGCACIVGGLSSFSGHSSSTCDYICVAQSKKPIINVWHWGKNQVHMQCHVQEVITSLASDRSGTYLIGGSKKGTITVWEISTGALLVSWQAHFQDISKIKCHLDSYFFCSASSDGMARVWNLSTMLDTSKTKNGRQSVTPYK